MIEIFTASHSRHCDWHILDFAAVCGGASACIFYKILDLKRKTGVVFDSLKKKYTNESVVYPVDLEKEKAASERTRFTKLTSSCQTRQCFSNMNQDSVIIVYFSPEMFS